MVEQLRVLMVDDEAGMRQGVERILQSFTIDLPEYDHSVNFIIELADSGEAALELLSDNEFDIMLLDHKMPGISGLDVLAWLNDNPCSMQTIMVTAYASLETAVEAMKRGAHDFLAKPFTPEELRSSISKIATSIIVQRQVLKLAEEKRRVRFEFISVLAHELKAPLGAIEGYLQLLQDGTVDGDPAATERILGRSMARLQGMRKLIMDLLDMTRVESGIKPREFVDLDLRDVAAGVMETMQPEAHARGISLELNAEAPVLLQADVSELEMLLNNLVSNAVKYNRDDGRVEIALKREGDIVSIKVSDTGIGMSAEETTRLFKEFVRIKNSKTRGIMGTGLGLSTVKKLALLNGGEVSVSSTPDVGTTFTVTLQSEKYSGAADS